jgi:two-component system OmpR family response regulator
MLLMSNIRPNPDADAGQPLVLVAEQHCELSEALVPWLSASLAPCRVLTAQTGEQCVAAVRAHRPQAVLLELHLCGMSGIEVTRRIKAESPDTPIIILSLFDAATYRSEALRAGACDYVVKSRATRDLLPRLRDLLHGSAACPDAQRGDEPLTDGGLSNA